MDDSTELVRKRLTKLLTDTMGKETGQLFNGFYEFDDINSMLDGARALLEVFMGREMTAKKMREVTRGL